MKKSICKALLCLSVFFSFQTAHALSTRDIYASAKDSVVLIIAYDKSGVPLILGSGFFISERKIVTNYHVINGAAREGSGETRRGPGKDNYDSKGQEIR